MVWTSDSEKTAPVSCLVVISAYLFPSLIPTVCAPVLSVPLGVIIADHTADMSFFSFAMIRSFLVVYRVVIEKNARKQCRVRDLA